ncbi:MULTISPECIES: nitroreductase family protein [Curtobacterium]|uniref:nitroreductase family protein n=1 Tax=Curtobacterium TaxID=2034 RepID=UPI0008F938D9|nr:MULTISPECIES: nitroreductase family protein [Curtobacterium]MBO9045874.1 nitroreductase family protein [Curtobacterium flaccumfaciens pv. flaccumfaciens]MBO9055502.1 nitroreductase family protein [Curtobacterium flaccumfaciens pv. flaccumfaciens]MCS6549951.1 nitroreductase family protein [Curtobacterium flaccumfaciens pv. flaccumfaciens]MCS6557402.1 nitroreductase family protein [Curtobacterium flaccumfaciens]MCS6580055.1 nitroreductase family protein [Curtobacterium flaccumfaciens pv. beti
MELFEAIRRRRTTNGPFLPDPVSDEHQRLLMELAGRAPSQLNSQPWRFVLIEERQTIDRVAEISGSSMTRTMAEGTFFERYKPYFRFSKAEMDERRDGMLFDKLPGPLRPFTKQVFTKRGQLLMNTLRVPQTLGEENRKLVAGSPLLLGVLLDRHEYRKEELSGFYSVFSMGAAMENIWLATTELGLGIQFVSFPMETPGAWEEIEGLLRVPESLELMAVYRIGYLPPERRRPAIDWTSSERKRPSQYVFRGTCDTPQRGWDDAPVAAHIEPEATTS